MDHHEILRWLKEMDEDALLELWIRADRARATNVGDAVHFRSLIEISNYCTRECQYCGISASNRAAKRYRMTAPEILACAKQAKDFGYGTVVLQAGEDPGLTAEFISELVKAIKVETGLAVTLSLGERKDAELIEWKESGADRYLLRFETSDSDLYREIHPALPGTLSDRIAMLFRLGNMGYEIGSGIMVGIPGQTWDILARDLETFWELDLDMIGVESFIPNPRTPLGSYRCHELVAPPDRQVPNNELTTLKTLALARILCPEANIPCPNGSANIDPEKWRELGLMRGANIVMPNMTPPNYPVLYETYPGKACIHETVQVCRGCMEGRVLRIGRIMGHGPGGRHLHAPVRLPN